MLRKTLTILPLIGLVLSVGLWGVSYFDIGYYGDRFAVEASAGGICLHHTPVEGEAFGGSWSWARFRFEAVGETRWLPFSDLAEWPSGYWEIYLPLWMTSLPLAVLVGSLHRSTVSRTWTAFSLRKWVTVASLIGLLSALGLWTISYWSLKYVPMFGDRFYSLECGCLATKWTGVLPRKPLTQTIDPDDYGGAIQFQWLYSIDTGLAVSGFKGFSTSWIPTYRKAGCGPLFSLPLWIPAVIFAIWPACLLSPVFRRRRRRKLGLCVQCGYNLHGLGEDRCPECGTPFEKP